MYTVISDLIDKSDCEVQQVLDYVGSAGFVVPVIVILL